MFFSAIPKVRLLYSVILRSDVMALPPFFLDVEQSDGAGSAKIPTVAERYKAPMLTSFPLRSYFSYVLGISLLSKLTPCEEEKFG